MKIKKALLVLGSLASAALTAGGVFASYTITDTANKTGIRIQVEELNFYLNSVSNANKLTSNGSGVWESDEISASYGTTYQIVDENGNNVGSSYTTTTEGKYKFTYTYSTSSTSVEVLEKTVYFNFLSMANGAENGRVWNQFYCYAYKHGTTDETTMTWPGQVMTSVNSNGLYKLTINGDYDKVVFNNGGTDENGHMIKTADLSYDISKPQFGCTSKSDLTTYVASATPTINSSSSFDYFLHTNHNNWVERSRAYGFELTEDSSQYLLRCFLDQYDELGIKNNTQNDWWGINNMGSWDGDNNFSGRNGNISVNYSDWYNIYFKPGEHKIYILRG